MRLARFGSADHAAAGDVVLGGDIVLAAAPGVRHADGPRSGHVLLDVLLRVAVLGVDLLVGALGVVLVVRHGVRLHVVAEFAEPAEIVPSAKKRSRRLADAAGDDEPGEAEAVLLALLDPPGVVGLAVVVDGDRHGGVLVVGPQADVGLPGLLGPDAIVRHFEAAFLRRRRQRPKLHLC